MAIKKYLPFLIIITVSLLLGIVIVDFKNQDLGGQKAELKEWEKPGKEHLKLKGKTLYSEDVRDIRCQKDNSTICSDYGLVKHYLHVTDKKVENKNLIIDGKTFALDKRGISHESYKSIKTDMLGAGENEESATVFYTGNPFYQEPTTGEWFETGFATTTPEAYEEQTESGEMLGASGDPIYVTGGQDGSVRNYSNVTGATAEQWNTLRGAASGDYAYVSEGSSDFMGYWYSGNKWMMRAFYSFPTDVLPEGITITAAHLYVREDKVTNTDNDGRDYHVVVKGYQASTSTIATADFNDCGSNTDVAGTASNTPVIEGSDRKDITNFSTGYVDFTLNATGTAWILTNGYTKLCVREGHDVENNLQSTSTSNRTNMYYAEAAGTADDPKLVVTYTEGGGGATNTVNPSDIIYFD